MDHPRSDGQVRKAPTGSDSPTPDGARPLVLLVDDFDDAREMYSQYLDYSGYEVVEAADGQQALELAFEHLPQVILMDLALPRMDGWEVTRRLKADPRTADIPVIALTGHALSLFREAAQRAGCDAWITKPCLPEDLVREIRRVLDATRRNRRQPS